MYRRLVSLLLVLFVAGAVAAAEVAVSDFTLGLAPGSKRLPAIAAGDGGYLAVWLDERNGSRALLATRIAPGGEPLDPLGIPLGLASFFRPQVLWNGDGYLVLWNDPDGRLMIARVSPDGLAEAPRVLMAQGRLDQRPRAVATNGTHIVVGYTHAGRMNVAVLTREGVLIGDRIVDERNSATPTVLANGNEFLVAWSVAGSNGEGDFVALRLDSRGAAIDASPRRIGQGWDAEILRNGSDYVVVAQAPNYVSWSVSRDLTQIGTTAPLPLNHYDRAPSLLDGSPAMMAVFESSENAFLTAVTFGGNGHEAGPRKRIVQSGPYHFAVARGEDALAVIEVKNGEDFSDALIGSLFDDGTLSRKAPDRALALSAAEEGSPVIAGGKGRYLAVWNGPRGLTAGRFLPDGTRLDGNGFLLEDRGYFITSPPTSPSVVFDGERFVVSYRVGLNYSPSTFVRYVSPTEGLLPESQGFDSETAPTLTVGNHGVVLATWAGGDGVYAAALQGAQLIALPRKIAHSSHAYTPVAAWNGHQFLVVWDEADFDYDMYMPARLQSMRIWGDLAIVDAQPQTIVERGGTAPAIAAWKRGWVIAIEDGANIRLHDIDLHGHMTQTPLATMPGSSPKLVNAASQPWLAWTTYEKHLLTATPIELDGTLGKTRSLTVAAPPFGSSFGHATALGALGNDIAAAYARVAVEAGFVQRVFVSTHPQSERPIRRRVMR